MKADTRHALFAAPLFAASLLAALATPAHAGNLAACEIVLTDGVGEAGEATIASYRDATPVLASIYDPDSPLLVVVDGHPVRGILCTRRDPVPDRDDFPIIASGLPFVVSTDFDSTDAPTVTIALDAERQPQVMMAVGLSARDQERLDGLLEAYTPPEVPAPAAPVPDSGVEIITLDEDGKDE